MTVFSAFRAIPQPEECSIESVDITKKIEDQTFCPPDRCPCKSSITGLFSLDHPDLVRLQMDEFSDREVSV